jgi:predicted RNA-binding Zn-ribbon protein involved in translation (DUF1610 family)
MIIDNCYEVRKEFIRLYVACPECGLLLVSRVAKSKELSALTLQICTDCEAPLHSGFWIGIFQQEREK